MVGAGRAGGDTAQGADAPHVVLRLFVGRNLAAMLIDGQRPGVVGGQRQFFVVVVADPGVASDSWLRRGCSRPGLKGSSTPKRAAVAGISCIRPIAPFGRDRPRIERRFHLNDRPNQVGPNALQHRMLANQRLVAGVRAHQHGEPRTRAVSAVMAVTPRPVACRRPPGCRWRPSRSRSGPGQAWRPQKRTARAPKLRICFSKSTT